jgi:predicted GNAT superfamily acetyltransferase
MDAQLLDPATSTWSAAIDAINQQLCLGENPTLLPNQFVKVVLPKLGGHIVSLRESGEETGIGFLLPRGYDTNEPGGEANRRAYTLRYHALAERGQPSPQVQQAVIRAITPLLHGAQVQFYDPAAPLHYQETHREIGSVCIGRPGAGEAIEIPHVQQRIWDSTPEFLYPADMHSIEFQLGTSLVARVDGHLAAFLFGFHKFGGPPLPADWPARFGGELRLESQTLGVLPDFRGMRIANLLKKVQAEEAWQAGIGVINWTADPLQFPNAALNFGLLRALAFHFYPDFYPFRNALNRVPASRFALTWLVGSERAQNVPLTGARSLILDLRQHPEIQRVNEGYEQYTLDAGDSHIAIEIPGDWTMMQALHVDEAARWREATDRLFSHYVGAEEGQYVITGVATDRDQHFLIGQRVDEALLAHLGHVTEE